MTMRDVAMFVAGLALAVFLLYWVLGDTDLAALGAHVAAVPRGTLWLGLGGCAVLNVGHNVFRVWRWRALLHPVRPDVPFRPMFSAVVVGYLASWTVPGRLGEVIRPAMLSGRERLPLGACLGSVLADRVLDAAAVVFYFALGIWTTPLPLASPEQTAYLRDMCLLLVVAMGIPLGFLLFVASRRERLEARFAGRRGGLAWVVRTTIAFSRGTEALARPGLLLRIVFHTLAAWGVIVLATWAGVRACGIDVTPGAIAVIMPLLVLGIAVPTPGAAGGYHLAMKFGLVQLFGVAETAAVAAGLIVHLAIIVPVVSTGLLLLVVDRVPFTDLLAAARQVKSLGDEPVGGASS